MKRPGLAGILYGINITMGVILSIPIFIAFAAAISDSGFSPEMAEQFDIGLWADMLEETGPIFQILMGQLIWMIPLIYIWKVASSVAVVHAVQGSGEGSFWQGVGQHTGRALLLGLPFVGMALTLLIAVVILVTILGFLLTGEVVQFWIRFVFTPIILFIGLAFVDMMHDFARIELVVGKKKIMESWFAGVTWFLHSGTAHAVYLGWLAIGLVTMILPLWANVAVGGLFLAFLLQQTLLFIRSMVTVGWIASEVMLYEDLVDEDVEVDEDAL